MRSLRDKRRDDEGRKAREHQHARNEAYKESFRRINETCPKLAELIGEADTDTGDWRHTLHQEIYTAITSNFREELIEALKERYLSDLELTRALNVQQEENEVWNEYVFELTMENRYRVWDEHLMEFTFEETTGA